MKKKNMMKVLFAAGALAAALTGCGGSDAAAGMTENEYEAAYDTAGYDGGSYSLSSTQAAPAAVEEAVVDDYGYEGAEEAGANISQASQDALAGRKLIKNVNLNVETEQFDMLVPNLEQRVTALGGYIEDMSSYSRNDQYSSDYQVSAICQHDSAYSERKPECFSGRSRRTVQYCEQVRECAGCNFAVCGSGEP